VHGLNGMNGEAERRSNYSSVTSLPMDALLASPAPSATACFPDHGRPAPSPARVDRVRGGGNSISQPFSKKSRETGCKMDLT
jgi:hypothetical protein